MICEEPFWYLCCRWQKVGLRWSPLPNFYDFLTPISVQKPALHTTKWQGAHWCKSRALSALSRVARMTGDVLFHKKIRTRFWTTAWGRYELISQTPFLDVCHVSELHSTSCFQHTSGKCVVTVHVYFLPYYDNQLLTPHMKVATLHLGTFNMLYNLAWKPI